MSDPVTGMPAADAPEPGPERGATPHRARPAAPSQPADGEGRQRAEPVSDAPAGAPAGDEGAAGAQAEAGGPGARTGGGAKRRRGSRGGRKRRAASAGAGGGSGAAGEAGAGPDSAGPDGEGDTAAATGAAGGRAATAAAVGEVVDAARRVTDAGGPATDAARRPATDAGGAATDAARRAATDAGGAATDAARTEYDRRPDDLPDRPIEGRPPADAARVEPAPRRPRIGDTRPAPAARPAGGESRPAPPARPSADKGGNGSAAPAAGARKKRRRGGRGRGNGRAGVAAVEAGPTEADDGLDLLTDADAFERTRGKERHGRPVGRYLMAVHVRPHATQIAVLEGRALIEHYVSRPQDDANQIDGNIYLARVQNVLPGMEAAFVDIGTPKNAVLYRGDVRYDPDDLESGKGGGGKVEVKIEHLLKSGQTILCQVTKNPIGTKGARLTQEVSLPGRFVVLIPNSDTYGISKRLTDDERKRLRRILDEVKPERHGIIVRTAAEGTTADELRRDVLRLVKQWEDIEKKAKRSKAPALLYKEPDMAVRVIREEFSKQYRGVVIDDRTLYEEVREYVASISPGLADRVEYYDPEDDPLPIFERYHVHEQLHKALDRKVWLPSGGSIIIERTEALTVIDVNTGKNVGTSSLEETVFRNNLEAAEEIARQLRLRDIGGIIVIDFIDMEVRANREQVMRAFREALSRDKTRTQAFDISDLGLVEMTRKRVSEGLIESFSGMCPTCGGRGLVFDESLL